MLCRSPYLSRFSPRLGGAGPAQDQRVWFHPWGSALPQCALRPLILLGRGNYYDTAEIESHDELMVSELDTFQRHVKQSTAR